MYYSKFSNKNFGIIFVSKKILRKLEGKDSLKINSSIGPFIDEINTEFGKENMLRCKEYVSKFQING